MKYGVPGASEQYFCYFADHSLCWEVVRAYVSLSLCYLEFGSMLTDTIFRTEKTCKKKIYFLCCDLIQGCPFDDK